MNEVCPNCGEESTMKLKFDIVIDKSLFSKITRQAMQCDNRDCSVKFFDIDYDSYYWGREDCDINGWFYKGKELERA